MEKVLITGGRGFIGQYVVKILQEDYEICMLEEDIFNLDINNYIKEKKPQYLIHLAWITGYGYLDSYENVRFVKSGIELCEAFYQHGGKRAVYVGTEQEYERLPRALKETDRIDPISLYAECKADLGKILVKNSQIQEKGFVWGRLFFIYGPGEKPSRLMPSIIKGLLKEEVVTCSYHEYVRDYIYVEDVASAIVSCLFSEYTGYVNIGGGRATTIGEIAEIAETLIGGKGKVTFKAHEECKQPMHIQADTTLLESLGWKQKYTLKQGIEAEINELKK